MHYHIDFSQVPYEVEMTVLIIEQRKLKLTEIGKNSPKASLLVNNRARIQFKYPSLAPKRLNKRRERVTTNYFKALSGFLNIDKMGLLLSIKERV